MIKRIFKIILISFIFVLVLFNFKTLANTKTTIHYIFDKLSVKENEEFMLTIILEDYQDLIGVQFVCDVDEKIFVPISKNNKYFQKPSQSIFEEKEIYENSYTTNQGLRFSGLTKNGKTYGYSNLNMVFSVSFVSKTNIEDISKYFSSNIEVEGVGSRIILIDKWLNEIDYQINYCESLKASWSENKYVIEVFGKLPNIEKDITCVKDIYTTMYPCVWNKIFKKELFDNDVYFKKGVWFEDVDFLYKLLPYTFDKRLYDYINNFNGLVEFYKDRNFYEEYKNELEFCYVRYIYATFLKRCANYSREDYKKAVDDAIENVKQNFSGYRKNKYFYKSIKGLYLLLFNKKIAMLMYKIYNK